MESLRRWLDPSWWNYLRHTYPDRLAVLGVLVAVGLGFAGYLSVSALGNGSASAGVYVQTRTVMRGVTRRFALVETQTVATSVAGKLRRVVTYRPVYRRKVVFVNGKPVTTLRVVTQRHVRTVRGRTRVVHRLHTVTRNETGPTQTVRVTGPGGTVRQTVVEPTTVRVTEPGTTVIQTQTQTETQTVPVTTTVTLPAETVTVTVTLP